MEKALRDFLEIPYDKLEDMNLQAKAERVAAKDPGKIREARMKYLTDEKRIKAVSVCFTDLEGRFHMLDYDKKFLLKSADNLTFDGSSIRGFSRQAESDLRLPGRLAGLLLPARRRVRPGQGAGVRRRLRPGRHALRGRPARAAQGARGASCARRTWWPTSRTRSRASSSRAATPSAATSRPASSSTSRPAATTTRCPATRCGASSTPRPRCSARSASRTRRTTRGGALAVRDELRLQRGRGRRRPGPALQADRAPGRGADGHDRVVPAQAGCRRQRQRLPHQHVGREEGQEHLLRREGPGRALVVRLELPQPDPGERQRHLPDPELERQLVPPPRPALRGAEPDQGLGQGPRLDGPHPDRQRAHRAHRGALDRARRRTRTWRSSRCSRPVSRARSATSRPRARSTARASCRTTSTTRSGSSRAASTRRSCWAQRSTRSTPS